MRPETSAWLMLLGFFVLFCLIVAGIGYAGLTYYLAAMQPVEGTLLRVHTNAGVTFQARGRVSAESIERLPPDRDPCAGELDVCGFLTEGDRIKTRPEAGYGPVASIVLPDRTQIDLWAHPEGAELELSRYQTSRWTDARQEVLLTQSSGYARYDLAATQTYRQVDFSVLVGDTRVLLEPGGSYSIRVAAANSNQVLERTRAGRVLAAEIAVRSGHAIIEQDVQQLTLEANELGQVATDGTIESPHPAEWQLIADGDFGQYIQQDRYSDQSQTWRRFWNFNPLETTEAEKNGNFSVIRACSPQTPDLCDPNDQIFIGQFRRDGNQTRLFITGIEQMIDADVSEYRSLRLVGWVRVLAQSIEGTGAEGSECPIMLQLVYKPTSPTDQERSRYLCVYSTEDPDDLTARETGEIRYQPVPPFKWYRLNLELRGDPLLEQARYIQMVRVEARGHDYLAEIANLSLIGRQSP